MKFIGKHLIRIFVCLLGTRMKDQRTGEPIGKILAFSWGGRIRCIGLWQEIPLKPSFESGGELRYWEQSLVFRSPEEVDFPNVRNS